MQKATFLISLGLRIKLVRIEKNMSQQELAGMCNFEKANMSRIENGGTNPTILTLLKISDALDINLSDLFDHSDFVRKNGNNGVKVS